MSIVSTQRGVDYDAHLISLSASLTDARSVRRAGAALGPDDIRTPRPLGESAGSIQLSLADIKNLKTTALFSRFAL